MIQGKTITLEEYGLKEKTKVYGIVAMADVFGFHHLVSLFFQLLMNGQVTNLQDSSSDFR